MASAKIDGDSLPEENKVFEVYKVYSRKVRRRATAVAAGGTASTDKDDANITCITACDVENSRSDVPQLPSQTLAAENANSHQQQTVPLVEVVSDDSLAQNRPSEVVVLPPPNGTEVPNGNGVVKPVFTRDNDRVKINLKAAVSKNDIRELRKRFGTELERVRVLVKKLESKETQLTQFSAVLTDGGGGAYDRLLPRNDATDKRALVRVHSEVGSVGHQDLRPFRQISVSVIDNSHGIGDFVEKEKRTPKANQYYRNSDFLLGKDRLPPESKRVKASGGKKHGRENDHTYGYDRFKNQAFKSCGNLLQRLMKHKHGWVFNEPVSAKMLGLHDYHDIIKHPMDLGTVKARLAQNFYKNPSEFAEDVRLTFRNAMTYNPKGQDVHVMAEQLSSIFEEKWAVIESEYRPEWRFGMVYDSSLSTPTSRKVPPLSLPAVRNLERSESMTFPLESRQKFSNFPPISTRTPAPRKPKAKDPNKRDMTYEEKQKLSTNLQSLPSEKLDNIVYIIKKRNPSLSQHDDEIEVDIDSVDAETLWELDRFVTNYKKNLSKHKRKAELALQARAEAGDAPPSEKPAAAVPEAQKEKKTDIKSGAATSPGQGERQGDNVSRSSSSSSSSSDSGSSSSDSDSDSSSADG